MPKPLIICIIDDDLYRYTILRTIESLKISNQNLVYTDGVNALKFISDNRDTHSVLPDIILLDVNMPVMYGVHIYGGIHETNSKIDKEH